MQFSKLKDKGEDSTARSDLPNNEFLNAFKSIQLQQDGAVRNLKLYQRSKLIVSEYGVNEKRKI